MTHLRVSDALFADPMESVVRKFLSSSLFDSELVTLRMPVEIAECNGNYQFLADLPGLKKDAISVRIDGNRVQIDVNEDPTARPAETGRRVLRDERNRGAISRSFNMAEDIDDTQVKASYVDGVLQLELPKKGTASAKRIAID